MAVFNLKLMVTDRGIEIPRDGFKVLIYAYGDTHREWSHRTLKAALRRLGSAISGKLAKRGEFAAVILKPDGTALSYTEAKAIIKEEAR